MKYLIQSGSNHVYIWTQSLARRKDMSPYEYPVDAIQNVQVVEPSSDTLDMSVGKLVLKSKRSAVASKLVEAKKPIRKPAARKKKVVE